MFQPQTNEIAFLKATKSTYSISGCFGQPGTNGQAYKAELSNIHTQDVWASGTGITESDALTNAIENAKEGVGPKVTKDAKAIEEELIENQTTQRKKRKSRKQLPDDDSPPDNGESD